MRELTVEEVKQVQLAVLAETDRWCREHQIPYYLAYGTLLGAVRHQGYIPWDDDIDIIMLRRDYEAFIRTFNTDRIDSIRVLHHSLDPNFPYEYAKIHDRSTKMVESAGIHYEIGINIDLFVLDSVPTEKLKKLMKAKALPTKIMAYKNYGIPAQEPMMKHIIHRTAQGICSHIPIHWCTSHIDRICSRYRDDSDCVQLADLCQPLFRESEAMERNWFSEQMEQSFEQNRFFGPKKYDEVLTAWYGDYMQLPPEEQRVTHHSYHAYQVEH